MIRKINLLQTESRWLLAGVCALAILLITYLGDLEGMIGEVGVLQADINDVSEQINTRIPEEHISQDAGENIDISELLQFIDDKQASLQVVDENQYSLELSVPDTKPLQQLLNMMMHYGDKYFINDFNFSITESKQIYLIFNFEVDKNAGNGKSKIKAQQLAALPLCHLPVEKQVLSDQASHYPLKDLYLLGMLQNKNGNRALVRFPNGVTRVMNLHEYLGREGGVITQINDKVITVKLPNNKEISCEFSASCYS